MPNVAADEPVAKTETASRPPEADSPVSAEESLRHFQIDPACRIELAAAEPEVVDPVAIRFDEDGRMWVVEMRDYPHGPKPGEEPASCIKVLEDKDGDGRFETATVFADKLLFPTGLQPWKGGVFVTLAGRVAYMKDTDGDGRCDLDETWFTGFAEENSQLRASHPTLGLDNHIYVANGLRGGKIVDARRKDRPPIDISGKDFRFDPLTGDCEAVTGPSQFGLTFDDWGNRFFCTNRNPLVHVVIEDRYLRANPYVRIPTAVQEVAAAGEQSRLYPLTRAWTTSNLHAGQFTAACGVTIYRGDALPEEFYGNAFTCDPTGNLVHREIVSPRGATFQSKPAYEGREFLASTDEWFRPVDLTLGPDGALYVVDMYRAVIEHPEFMPDELKARPDLMLGKERGRIYRIVGKEWKSTRKTPRLSEAKSEELVKLFEHENAWQRETGQRLIVDRADKSIADSLISRFQEDVQPIAATHHLWTLRGVDALPKGIDHRFVVFRKDVPVSVQVQAVLAIDYVDVGDLAHIIRAHDLAAHLRIGLAATEFLDTTQHAVLYELGARSANDPWVRHAVVVASADAPFRALFAVVIASRHQSGGLTDGQIELAQQLARLCGTKLDLKRRGDLLELFGFCAELRRSENDSQVLLAESILTGFLDALVSRGIDISLILDDKCPDEAVKSVMGMVRGNLIISARLGDPDATRMRAIELGRFTPEAGATLAVIALEDTSETMRLRCVELLSGRAEYPETWKELSRQFRLLSPLLRSAVLDSFLAREDRTGVLLDAIESGQIKPGELGQTRVNQLLNYGDAEIRERAAKLLAEAIPADRQKVLADYRKSLPLEADPHRGLAVFKKHCAQCHRVGEVGVNVAPDISDSRVKTELQILTDIVQPNRAIDANYLAYTVNTSDGRALTGVIASEAGSSVTLRMAEGKEVTLLRDEIAEMGTSGTSLMPEGLEKEIPYQDMADLIAYVKRWRYLDGRTPLGR